MVWNYVLFGLIIKRLFEYIWSLLLRSSKFRFLHSSLSAIVRSIIFWSSLISCSEGRSEKRSFALDFDHAPDKLVATAVKKMPRFAFSKRRIRKTRQEFWGSGCSRLTSASWCRGLVALLVTTKTPRNVLLARMVAIGSLCKDRCENGGLFVSIIKRLFE